MRYTVQVQVTVPAPTADAAKARVQALIDEAPQAHHVAGSRFAFAIGDVTEVSEVREDVTLNLTAEERTEVDRALQQFRIDADGRY